MPAELNFFDTYTLMAVYKRVVPKKTFFRDRYFPTSDEDIFASNKVLTEYMDGDQKMAAFVAPRVGAIPMERMGYEIHELEPAFIGMSRELSTDDLTKRGFGEAIYANSTPAQRAAKLTQKDLADMDARIVRREEWMCAQTMLDNGCTMQEMIDNQKIVNTFSRGEAVKSKFGEINGRLQKCSLKAIFFSSITNPATRFVNSLVYAGVGVFGALVAIKGGISVGRLSCFLSYANQYTKPFNEISGVVTELQNALACAARVFELLDADDQIPEAENAAVLQPDGHVQLEGVSFRYLPDRPLIEGLSLDVKPGQRIAIVGPTGCGKTTLINLLMRFYDVNGGAIKVSGTDIRSVTRASLRGSYGMVLQDTWLRAGTVRENIAYGKPDATLDEVVAAAKAAHADSFIRRLPDGYDTVIAEDGGNISQGQKQLLCIARVMLCLPPMLILDEATSSIDTRTEVRIQKAFARMMQGRTSFIVAHRLSTIREADIILVMKDGHIVEQGNHDELLAAGGFYAKLYNSQFEGVET